MRTLLWILIIVITIFFVVEFGDCAESCEDKQETCKGFFKEDMGICDYITEPVDKLTCQRYSIEHYLKCLGDCPEPLNKKGCSGNYILDFNKTQCGPEESQ